MLDRSQFRDASHYGLAVASEVIAPALRVLARAVSRSAPAAPKQWRTGVILGSGHIGDVLYRTCSLDALKRGLPECKWSYVTTPSAAAALAGNPSLEEVLAWSIDTDSQPLAPGRHSELARRRFDVALCSDNVGHHHAVMLALRLGIPNRVAFTRKGLSGLVTNGVQLTEPMSHSAAFRRMVDSVTGANTTSPLRPHIFPSLDDTIAADREWARLNTSDADFAIACAATTRQTIGDCPPNLFVDILRRALDLAPKARVILTGVASDRPLLEAIATELGERAVVSAGVLPVLAFGAMLGRCSVFIGTDSGSRHLANAADIPVFFVRNMGTTALETGAYCPTEMDIAPAGEYLSAPAMRNALEGVDRAAVAKELVTAARSRVRDKSAHMPL
ncbi:MAG: glycosyltransferase family 9 protein [Gemmatimonadaceae bacterium]